MCAMSPQDCNHLAWVDAIRLWMPLRHAAQPVALSTRGVTRRPQAALFIHVLSLGTSPGLTNSRLPSSMLALTPSAPAVLRCWYCPEPWMARRTLIFEILRIIWVPVREGRRHSAKARTTSCLHMLGVRGLFHME